MGILSNTALLLKAEVLNGLMGCHYRLWQGQHRQLWLAVVVSCLSSWQIAHNPPSGNSQGTTIRRLRLFCSVLMGYAHQFVR